jgi:hypothetical protein
MRFTLPIWAAILVFGLFTISSAVAPCHAAVLGSTTDESAPIITNATLSGAETTQSKVVFQTSPLSLSITTDKPVYLTGETVSITVSTNVSNTYVRLQAQLPDGNQETIGTFPTSGTHTLSWPVPATHGQIELTCEGQAIVEVWSTCPRYVCDGTDCWWASYPCIQSMTVIGNASYDIRVFNRVTSISGLITDTYQQPIPGATVYLSGTRQSTTANNNGAYQFTYELGNNYTLINQIPAVTETVSVEAVACEPQPGKAVQVQAERGASNVNFTLKRFFYPPAIDLSDFTFDAFPGWQEAKEYSTWQNILGITIEGLAEPRKLSYETKEISPQSFNIGNKKLYLITNPEFGRYFLELQGSQNTEYAVASAATLNDRYLLPISVSGRIEGKEGQRLRLILNQNGMELKPIKPFPLLLVIIPVVVVVIGGLIAAYFLTGRRFGDRIKQAFARIKFPRKKKPAKGKTRKKTRKKTKATENKTEIKADVQKRR